MVESQSTALTAWLRSPYAPAGFLSYLYACDINGRYVRLGAFGFQLYHRFFIHHQPFQTFALASKLCQCKMACIYAICYLAIPN